MVLIVVADALRGGESESPYVCVATPIVYYVNTIFLPIHVPWTYAKWWRLARPRLSASKNTCQPASMQSRRHCLLWTHMQLVHNMA